MDADAHQAIVDRAAVDVPPTAPRPLRSPAPETLRLYASDWAAFVTWVASLAQRRCRRPLPRSQPISRSSPTVSARAHWPGVPPPLLPGIASTGWPRQHSTRR
jgi:hypothetical protein